MAFLIGNHKFDFDCRRLSYNQLTGVISDTDRQVVTKWPILGDLPLIGQFFRNSGGERSKSELVVLVTPRIIDDSSGGTFGYGYNPSLPAARQIMSGR